MIDELIFDERMNYSNHSTDHHHCYSYLNPHLKFDQTRLVGPNVKHHRLRPPHHHRRRFRHHHHRRPVALPRHYPAHVLPRNLKII